MSLRETEVKLRVNDAEQAAQLIARLQGHIHQPRHFEDNLVFDTADLTLRKQHKLLRVRIVEGAATLTYKGDQQISDGVKDREELECTLQPADSILRILERLGYAQAFRYQKYRTIYAVDDLKVHVCVDETPIGTYLELEGEISDIHTCADRLGFDRSQYITESYGSLYFRWCNEHNLAPANMVFE